MLTSTNVNIQDVYLTYPKSIVPISSHYRCKASALAKSHLPSISTSWKPLCICKSNLPSISTEWKPLYTCKSYLPSVSTVWKPLCMCTSYFLSIPSSVEAIMHIQISPSEYFVNVEAVMHMLVRDIVSHIVELMSIYTDILPSEVNQGALDQQVMGPVN